MSQKSLKRTPKETPGARGRASKAISKESNKSLPACDLCTDFISSPEDFLKCEGPCQQYMHRYCAGLTRTYYNELEASDEPFKCMPCSLKSQNQIVASLLTTIEELKTQVSDLQEKVTSSTDTTDYCQDTVAGMQNDVQQLQSDLAKQRSLYSNIVKQSKKGANSAQRKRVFRPTLPPKEKTQGNKTKVTVQGSRKLWGTRRSTNTATIISSFNMIPNADPQLKGVTIKRKFKSNTRSSKQKWWFVIRSEESLLKSLDENWNYVKALTGWLLEPLLRYEESTPDENGSQHTAPPDPEMPPPVNSEPDEPQITDTTNNGTSQVRNPHFLSST